MHTCHHHELCQMFRRSAEWTFRTMTEADQLETPFNEETITEHILLDLKRYRSSSLEITPYNKNEESTTGADWMFVFSQNGYDDISVLVQAKRLYSRSGKYGAFDITKEQFKTLKKKAEDLDIKEMPIYVLYNNYKIFDNYDFYGNKLYYYLFSIFDEKYCPNHHITNYFHQWGCAVATVEAMENAGNNPSPDKIQYMLPWHMLFHSFVSSEQSVTSKQNYSLPDTVFQSLQWMQMNLGKDAAELLIKHEYEYEYARDRDRERDRERERERARERKRARDRARDRKRAHARDRGEKSPEFMSFLNDGEFEKLYGWMKVNEIRGLIHFKQSGE